MLSKEVEEAIQRAMAYAFARRHEFATIEHLALALLDNQNIKHLLDAFDVDAEQLKRHLDSFLDSEIEKVVDHNSLKTIPSAGLQRVVQNAVVQVYGAGKEEVSCLHILAEILNEEESHALFFFAEAGLNRLSVITFMSHGSSDDFSDDGGVAPESVLPLEINDPTPDALNSFAEDLTAQAKNGELDQLIGREKEIERLIHILLRRKKNNPLLVGEAGVGKTAIIEGLAQKIVQGIVPEALRGVSVFSLDMGSLVAGTRYRGDFENRLKGLIKALSKHPGAILVIDEIHTVIGAGSTSGSNMDASNLLKPLLNSGKIRCIGSTTYQEFRAHFDKDRALSRRFQKIDIEEPSEIDCQKILRGIKKEYEDFHQVIIDDAAIDRAISLSSRFLPERYLPDKAIDVIDEASAGIKMKSLAALTTVREIVTEKIVEDTIATMAQIPPQQVSSSDKKALAHLEQELKKVVFGQEEAIEAMSTVIKLSRVGLRDTEKPIGSFLFTGPTGVGKTEVAKQLAKTLGIKFIRFDMSEYMERHSVSRLVGAPPGYVGFEQGGLLTDAIFKAPHAVLLLDEIEKAHFDLFNMLLQVMDYGKLTDSNGRPTNFRHVILIMTSNLGARELAQRRIGFGDSENDAADEAIYKQLFSPEFRNRLDARIRFLPLSPQAMTKIVDKFILELREQLAERKVVLKCSPEARELLAIQGYDKLMGARPLARLIQDQIKKPLADLMLFGELQKGGTALIDLLEENSVKRIHVRGLRNTSKTAMKVE